MDCFDYLWKMEEKYNGHIPIKSIIIMFLVGITLMLGTIAVNVINKEFYDEHWKKPEWDYREEKGYDVMESDIELKAGNIIVTPQISVKYGKDVVFIIDIVSYYEKNAADLGENSNEEIRQFQLLVKDLQREKLSSLVQFIQEEVKEKVLAVNPNKSEKLVFEEIKVAKIHSQNLKGKEDIPQYVYIKDTKEIEMTSEEASMRKTVFNINLDNYIIDEETGDNVEVKNIISACVEKILKMK